MSLDWRDEPRDDPPPKRARPTSATNRQWVEVVTCPTCRTWHVRRKHIVGPVSHWICLDDPTHAGWKESSTVGGQGPAQPS